VDELGFSLYLITDRSLHRAPIADVVEECLAAGLRALQLREKDLATRPLLALGHALQARALHHGARLLVNDRADVALALGAIGVQRTHASLPVAALRGLGGPSFLIGASVHSPAEAREAAGEGADFLVFGPVFDTPSKRQYGPPQGLAALEEVAGSVRLPVLAVGGMRPERVREVLRIGASGVAVISGILAAERPADRVKGFLDALGRP
jgi:thiamine-phosphate pyrophosphorylase